MQHDLWVHLCCCKWHYFILFYDWESFNFLVSFPTLAFGFLMVDILMGMSYLIAILIYFSLIISDVWASFHVYIGHPYFGEISSQVLCTFFNGVVVLLLGHALQKEMATHSSVLAWRIPGTGEPGGLPSMGSHRVGHDWSDLAAAATCF